MSSIYELCFPALFARYMSFVGQLCELDMWVLQASDNKLDMWV